MIDHSIPKYPAFDGFKVNPEIQSSQEKYGQHIFCLSIDDTIVGDLITRVIPIRPYIYANNLNNEGVINKMISEGKIA